LKRCIWDRYSRQQIEAFVEEASAVACKYYIWTDAYLHDALHYIGGLKGKRVVVVGSLTPWYESVALAAGAESVTTIEYNALDYDHPRISTVTNAEWYGAGGGHERGVRFDVILSISSFEHDGLGRYGDKVDPDADIEGSFSTFDDHLAALVLLHLLPESCLSDFAFHPLTCATAVKRMKQLAVPGGIMLLAVPTGKDQLHWNIHRVYGRARLPLLLSSWKVEGIFGENASFYRVFDIL
jgi:hypothetical protein